MLRKVVAVAVTLGALAPFPIGAAAATTLVVDTFADAYDGSCADGDCSVRDAVSSAGPGDRISLPSGFYPLTVVEAGGPGDGTIEIDGDVEIAGEGETGAFLDASALGSPMFRVTGASELTLRRVTLFGATTDVGAPALWVTDGAALLRQVTITGGRGGLTGAVRLSSAGALDVEASLFLDNRAASGAGAIRADPGGVGMVVRDSAFVGNRGARGGAIDGPVALLENVTVWGNAARRRGGALRLVGAATIRNVTIAHNRAARAAAIAVAGGSEMGGTVANTVIAGNRSDRGEGCAGRLRSLGGNVEDGRSCWRPRPTDRRGDPGLAPLTSNGGPTPTAALRPSSIAIDAGGACPGRDQRGAPRDRRCDAGAYELVRCRGRSVDVVGTPGDDDLSGGRDDDTFLGMGGDDAFQGSLGRDRACAGPGDDHVLGGPGDDDLRGGRGADELDGEDGEDRCVGGPGRDHLISCESRRSSG